MSYDDEFLSQECYVYLSRVPSVEPKTRLTRSKRNSSLVETLDSETESEASFTNTPSKMSRPTRKRGSNEVDEPIIHTNKAKGGPLSVKKVKFGLSYDPEKDKLTFIPVDPNRYTVINTIIQPTYSDAVSDCCLFPLSKVQSKKINVDNYCVLLRLAYFNKQETAYEDIFDYGMNIRVNDVLLPLTAPTEEDPNAPLDGPADITRYLIAEGTSIEKIKISFEGQAKPHVFSVLFCKKKREELPYLPLRYMEPSQTFKLAHRANERFMADLNKVFRKVFTLLDPISKQRINIPIRGQSCAHVECFDKDTFLRANRRKLEWSCPICSKVIKEDSFVVDGLFTIILAKMFSSCAAVELDSQGGWSPVLRDKVLRVRTVDLENDYSEGEEEDEIEEEEEMKSPEGPLSPVDIPPEPEEPEMLPEFNVTNGGGDELNISREAETQTPVQDWSHNFEVEGNDDKSMDQPSQNENSNKGQSNDQGLNNEPATSSVPTTVIQRIEDEHEMEAD